MCTRGQLYLGMYVCTRHTRVQCTVQYQVAVSMPMPPMDMPRERSTWLLCAWTVKYLDTCERDTRACLNFGPRAPKFLLHSQYQRDMKNCSYMFPRRSIFPLHTACIGKTYTTLVLITWYWLVPRCTQNSCAPGKSLAVAITVVHAYRYFQPQRLS